MEAFAKKVHAFKASSDGFVKGSAAENSEVSQRLNEKNVKCELNERGVRG